jgi:DNA-binding response OmpR family regulator
MAVMDDHAASLAAPAQPLVLVAEDDDDLRELVQRRLQRAGFDVVGARDGASALALARSRRPDACVIDLAMPRLTGDAFLCEVRADPEIRRTPVVLMTGLGATAGHVAALRAGADGVMTKPADFGRLTGLLRALVARR